jgi:two-component system sensor histidine kinase PilS (NtrC family)
MRASGDGAFARGTRARYFEGAARRWKAPDHETLLQHIAALIGILRETTVRDVATAIDARTRPDPALSDISRREIYFFNLFRVFQAVVLFALVFSAYWTGWVQLDYPLIGCASSVIYLLLAIYTLAETKRWRSNISFKVAAALSLDVTATTVAMFSIANPPTAIAMLLLVNVGAGALLLPPRLAGLFAALAALGVLGQCVYGRTVLQEDRNLLEAGLYGLSYFATATLCFVLGKQMRETEALAEQRGIDLANLAQINELIIRRMKTGVLVVDDANRVHRWNESAWALMGNPKPGQRDLGSVAPELSRRLYHWRTTGKIENTAVALAEGVPEIIPRFTKLASNDDNNVLIFLDDTSLVSRRAEELTLSSLGRLSASIAHEIRNPLAAISYSAQLLAESEELSDADKRMVEIINNHCSRVNEIVENILQLSRRERSRPESIDLSLWAQHFVDEYKSGNDIGADQLRAVMQGRHVEALADPQQLQQVVWNLVQNALRYGRLPGESARVSVVPRLASDKGPPLIEVIDRGPGIPPKVAAQIFEPFFTTHEYGTGLGLYLARTMCDANQATLEYVPVAGGGSCFRITLAGPAGAAR